MTASVRFVIGDARERLAELPDRSVDSVMCSSPYYGQRRYLPPGHPSGADEIGQEATPGEFLATILGVADIAAAKLAPHGTMWWNLGDSAGGSYLSEPPGPGTDEPTAPPRYRNANRPNPRRDRKQDTAAGVLPPRVHSRRRRPGAVLDKSVCWIPQLFGASLAYGRNLLTGEAHHQWITRPPVTWCKENPSVGELIDSFRSATELLVWASTRPRYFFDLDAVRTARPDVRRRTEIATNPLGAPPLDWWSLSTRPYPGAHHAVMPAELLELPIRAAVPERVCAVCGKPWERQVVCHTCGASGGNSYRRRFLRACSCPRAGDAARHWERTSDWDRPCRHDQWRPGLVVDPFAGSGTTGERAFHLGRSALLIDLDERNVELARHRLGMWLELDETPTVHAAI